MKTVRNRIVISILEQTLFLFKGETIDKQYPIASAKNGVGQQEGSECTPLGQHRIAKKIGSDAPIDAVFVGRQWHGELYTENLAQKYPERDWILTRILWLDGLEKGVNSGFQNGMKSNQQAISCDTKSRYIYIHGCPDSHAMQIPSSHGCIKMRNNDIIELFEIVSVDTEVLIQAGN